MNILSLTPTIDAGAYASGDAIGGKLTFEGAPLEAIISSITVIDKSRQSASIDIVFFNQDFTATTNNAVFKVQTADISKLIGAASVTNSNYKTLSTITMVTATGVNLPYKSAAQASNSKIYGQLVSRGTPTYATTSALTVKLGVLRSDE